MGWLRMQGLRICHQLCCHLPVLVLGELGFQCLNHGKVVIEQRNMEQTTATQLF